MAFQTEVNIYQAPGREGSFASCNAAFAVVPPAEGFRTGKDGVTMARFVWRDASNDVLVNNTGTGAPLGFVGNEMTGIIGVLDATTMHIYQGAQVSVYMTGDFWGRSATETTIGQKVFAVLADGSIKTGAAGATVDGAVETPFVVMTSAAVGEIFKFSSWS
jgi:hypothetical protein